MGQWETTMSGYDVIGDVHGHAVQLRGLLAKLGYTDVDGVWKHPSRTAVFVGDLIDRGDHQLEVVAIVRAMVEAGAARIVLGNHEFNAVAWATPDPDHPGKFLRSHNEKNREQHHEFLEQVGEGSDRHRAIIDWFMTIPLWLDLDGLRVVHACWDPRSIARLDGLVSPSNTLTPELVVASSRSGTVAFKAVETLLKGPEIPVDPHYLDKGGHERCCARFRWWLPDATTLRAGAEIPPDTMTVDGEPYPVLSDEPIDKAVSRMGLGMASNRARAYVIAGTAGGTGGGMFLDLAYIIKNEFRQIGYVRPETVGVLLVPAADRTVAKGQALANTFGALTELHHFHQGRSRYTVRFDNAEPTITDGDGPFSRCGLVQSGNRNTPTEQSKTAGLIARTLYLDLFTTAGRTIDSIRKEAFDLNREGISVVQSTGVYRINWPRDELLTISTRSFAQRLIQRWTAKDAAHLREPIQTWLNDQWQKRNLELEVVVGEFEKAIKDALREDPDRVFHAFVDPLRQRTPGAARFDAEAAIAVLEQILNVVGKPEHESDKVGTLKAVLDRRGKTLAAEAEGHLSAMAVSFIEQPQYRMPGTEEVLSQITERLKRTIDGLTGVRTGLVREVWDTYSRIFPVIGNLSGGLGMIGTRKATVTSELFDLFQSYPTKRLKLLVLDATLAIYRSLLSSVPEYTREVGMCRARLMEISQSFAPTEKAIPFHSGPGRMILPQGVEGVDGAADLFLASLSSKEILDFDSGLQQEIAKRFRSLVNVCVKPEYAPLFATLLMTQSHAFLDIRLERSDPAAVHFRSRDVGPGTDKMLIQAFEGAAPDVTSVSGKAQMEATILACPLGPNGDRFRDLVEATLPGIGFIPAVLSDDIAFIREYPLLPLNEVPQLAGHAREAYAAQLAAESSPHTRTDIAWPSVGTP